MSEKDTGQPMVGRHAAVAMTGAEFREVGHEMINTIAEFIDSIRERPVGPSLRPSDVHALLPAGELPEHGVEATQLLAETSRLLLDNSLLNGHPRFFGYITSSAAPIGALGDLLAAAVNPNLGGWQLSPVASEIEKQAVRWVAELIGFPTAGGGLFTSGGNVANFVGFLAARQAKASWKIREEGLAAGGGKMLVYATGETHTWLQKATDLFGHGTTAVRNIPRGNDLRGEVNALRDRIAEDRKNGDHPFLLVGTAGTVGTGAIDPLRDMAAIARECDLWFHVDGAYGALAAALPDVPDDLRALSEADSVAVDPHKWLYAPMEAGCALVRDPDALAGAFSYRPEYYRFDSTDEPETNFYELGLQNSRGFRALKVWLALRQAGRSGYVEMMAEDIRLARETYRVFGEHPEFEAVTQGLSIATFRYVPADIDATTEAGQQQLNDLNERLLERLKTSGEIFVSNAVVNGKFVLRACIVNFRTTQADIEALPEIIARHGRAVCSEMDT